MRTSLASTLATGESIAVAESSAGGLISAALLGVPGASAYFLGGAVVYTRAARGALLGISDEDMAGMRSASEPYAQLLARRVRERAENSNGLAGLNKQRLIVLQIPERLHDCMERFPASGRPAGAPIDDEVIWVLGHLGIEVVHQHPQGGFLDPALAGALRAARGADASMCRWGNSRGSHVSHSSEQRIPTNYINYKPLAVARATGDNAGHPENSFKIPPLDRERLQRNRSWHARPSLCWLHSLRCHL